MSNKTSLIQEQVVRFLQQNPDFFSDNPELLDNMNLNHPSGDATSLIEHQLKRLQSQNRDLNRKLRQLVQVAGDNEQLMTQLHELTLQLIPIKGLSEFFATLVEELASRFGAEQIFIGVFGELPEIQTGLPVRSLDQADPELKLFASFLELRHTTCGRLSKSKLDFLFGTDAESVQSCAMVPLGAKSEYGLLAIGSNDPAKFFPGMGTLFLDLLGAVISHRLMVSEVTPQRLTA